MPVDPIPRDVYSSNKSSAERLAKAQADFIVANLAHLKRVDASGKLEKAARSFRTLLANGETLTPNQYSFLESIYEKVMGAAGFPSVNVRSDRKKRSLKFG